MKQVIPKTAWITTNQTCNIACSWCYEKECTTRKNMVQYEKLEKLATEFNHMNIKNVVLTGGETTIHPDIEKIVELFTNKGISVSMATNGIKFSDMEFVQKLVSAGLKSCNLSLKGANENEYLQKTKSLGFKDFVKGYKNLRKLNIPVCVSYVLYETDLKKIDKVLNSMVDNGFEDILFTLYKPSVNQEEIIQEDPTMEELAKVCEYVFEFMEKTNINYKFEMSIPLCLLDSEILKKMIQNNRLFTCCYINGGEGIVFDTNFNILPCNFFVNYPLNDNKVSFNKILDFWNSLEVTEFRNHINTYPTEICSRCSKWDICGGGCAVRWLTTDPNTVVKDIYVVEEERQVN